MCEWSDNINISIFQHDLICRYLNLEKSHEQTSQILLETSEKSILKIQKQQQQCKNV